MVTNPVHVDINGESFLCAEYPLLPTAEEEACISTIRESDLNGRLRNLLRDVLWFAVPSFWQMRPAFVNLNTTEKVSQLPAPQSRSTQYLHGVRGVASFIVFIFHFAHMFYPGTNKGFGIDGQTSIWQLPMIRLVYSGAAMVSVFFVVSGYVLSHRFIEMLHIGDYDRFHTGLTSLAFRRAVRLFLPVVASIILQFAVALLFPGIIPRRINGKTFQPGVKALLQNVDKLTNPWTWDPYMDAAYNPQLWSIALEYRGSMIIFITLLALSRTRLWARMMIQTAITAHAFSHKRWDVALFMAGMLIAELDIHIHSTPTLAVFMRRKAVRFFLMTALLTGVWLSGFPRDKGIQSYGYGFLRHSWPYGDYRRRFWLGISAILIVAPMPFLPSVQQLFNSPITTYLGRISFSLYLIHGLGNRTVASWLIQVMHSLLGKKTYWACVGSFVATALLYIPIIIWWADIFWRAIDRQSTTLAKWLEQKTRRPR